MSRMVGVTLERRVLLSVTPAALLESCFTALTADERKSQNNVSLGALQLRAFDKNELTRTNLSPCQRTAVSVMVMVTPRHSRVRPMTMARSSLWMRLRPSLWLYSER